jgi:hypothetical protein
MDVTVYLSLVDQEHLSLEISETVAFGDPLVVFSSAATLLQGILRGPAGRPGSRREGWTTCQIKPRQVLSSSLSFWRPEFSRIGSRMSRVGEGGVGD